MKRPYFKPKLYLSARISPDAHPFNNKVADILSEFFDVFKPHEFQCCETDHTKLGPSVYIQDLLAMQNSDLAVLLPPFGKDCSFEAGWYVGAKKPIILYVTDQLEFMRDLMVKGGVSAVFTNRAVAYTKLMKDPVLRYKTYFVDNESNLAEQILLFYNDISNGKVLMDA